ncbi:MAG: hypothetical protein KGH63_03540 [Candidatus Micrarchaeota archaeon]|nr:hypothetical protein [Candidatus Micrarchaeota archaeon]
MAKSKPKNTAPRAAGARAAARSPGAAGPWAPLTGFRPFVAMMLLCAVLLLAVVASRRPAQTVSVDFLYSQACEYCVADQPNVEAAVAQMSGAVQLTYLDAGQRAANQTLAAIYQQYKDTGLFGGFPTLVAHGPKGVASLVGLRSQAETHAWLCEQFTLPPAGC